MSYMCKLSQVAVRASGYVNDVDMLGGQLFALWCELESWARSRHYDIFQVNENCIMALCQALYKVPTGETHAQDIEQLRRKDAEYGGSWCKRGGQGAFFMLARKWDRIEIQMNAAKGLRRALENDNRQEGILDDIGDLRRYLLLVLAYLEEQRDPTPSEAPRGE
jgi:hypothetical protein